MQYYIKVGHEKKNTAGDKAPRDISVLCQRLGMQCFPMPRYPFERNVIYRKIWLVFVCLFYWIKLWIMVKRDDVVLYQHPMYGNRISAYFIPLIQKRKECKFIALIHDLESLRKGVEGVHSTNPKTADISDNKLLKCFDVIICHNDHMKQYLIGQGFDAGKLVCLEIFDYLCDCDERGKLKGQDPSVAIAGNLAPGKCAYIYDILNNTKGNNLTLHLYGDYFDESMARTGIVYHGSYPPEELPKHLKGDFGLIWDGTSIETCEGNTGEYLKYNDPHKTSLYLASGMPVIVWSQAAISDFILQHGVGIVVDNLNNLDEVIAGISNDQYKGMCINANKVGKKIRSGEYFTSAFKKSMEIINKQQNL